MNDIVIEFGSRLGQPTLDRYIDGEEVSLADLQQVWRNTTKVFAFESPIYAQLLAEIRQANRGLPRAHRLRVLAGDSPIDGTKVTTHAQWESYQPNDFSFAEVINAQVPAQNKVLVIMGGSHVSKSSEPARDPNTTTLVERKKPGTVYVVLLDQSKKGSDSKWKPPASVPTMAPCVGDYGDALLYLGENLSWAQPDWQQYRAEPAYLKELDRRARIE